jgi:hypothetical protein
MPSFSNTSTAIDDPTFVPIHFLKPTSNNKEILDTLSPFSLIHYELQTQPRTL